jgi:hypothetical protein
MPIDMHTVEVADGSTPTARTDRLITAFLPGLANAAGAEGAAVTTTVSGLVLPSVYGIHAMPSQAAVVSFGAKTNSGFTITLTPLSSTQTIGAGTIDVAIFA